MAFLFAPRFQAVDANGLPLSGALLYFYRGSTSAAITTYQDAEAATPHANPVVADSSGTFPAIFLNTVNDYKFIIKSAAGITIATVDDVPVGGQIDAGALAAAVVAAETARTGAEAAASSTQPELDSRAYAIASYAPAAAPNKIRTAGYASAGDGGGALYKKVATQPTHEGKLSITLSDGVTVVWYELADRIVLPQMLGAVIDNTAGDLTKVKQAWKVAVAIGKPFLVPILADPMQVMVPEDIATVQTAHNAMLNWIFPGPTPKYADDASGVKNHQAQVLVELSVSGDEYTTSGKGIVWNHPAGNVIRVKGRDAVGLTFGSLVSTSYASGVHFVVLRFTSWPATAPVVGRAMRVLLPTGTGDYRALDGAWRITAVDAVNKDITLAVYSKKKTAALVMTLTGGTFVYIPTQFRFINLPVSGADVGGFDVFTVLRLEDVTVSGSSSGTNAADVDGIIARDGAKVYLEQHCGILEWNRCGLWLLNGASGEISYSGICGNGIGLNVIQGAHVDGGYVGIQGNTTYNVVVNTGANAGLTNLAAGGCAGTGIAVLAGATAVLSGHANHNTVGLLAGDGGVANINSMTIQNNTEVDVKRTGPGAHIIGTSLANVGTANPPKNIADISGGITADSSGVVQTALVGNAAWNPASIANGAQEATAIAVTGAAVGMRAEAWANTVLSGLRLWAQVTAAGTVTCYLSNTTGAAVDLGLFTVYVKVIPAET